MSRIMEKTFPLRRGRGRPLGLVLALLAAAWLAGQTSASAAEPAASTAKAAKSAKVGRKPAAPEFKMILEPRAIDLLQATSAKLAAAKSMSFTAVVNYEYPSRLGPPIVYAARYEVTMQRPDKLRVVLTGDGPASEFYYDGKSMMAYAPAEDLVAMAEAPPTIDAALKAAYDTAAIYYPFTDLIVDDPYAALTGGAVLAFYIGRSGVIGGTQTDMVAWANDDVFLQIWIGVDDQLPRRIRAVYRTDPLRLRHEMELSNWQLDGAVAAEAFVSEKAKAGKHIPLASPVMASPPVSRPLASKAAKGKPAKSQTKAQ